MNLNEIMEAVQTTDREVEFKPAGVRTGWIFTLRHESAPEVQEVMRVFNSKVRDLALKRKNAAYKNLVAEHEDSLRIAHVAGWKWELGEDEEQGRPSFSKRELKSLLHNEGINYHLRTFIDEEVGSLEDFLSRSESN